MSQRASNPPIHLWFGAALVVIAAMPALAAWGTYTVQTIQQQEREQRVRNNVRLARRLLVADVGRWANPTWQSTARARLAAWGVKVQLSDSQGQSVFATTQRVPGGWGGEKLVVSKSGDKSAFLGGGALFYALPGMQSWEGPLIASLAALLVTLGVTAWVLGRTIVRPLAAVSHAARGIVGGNLDVRLTRSQVREVAEVAAALETMCAGLRDAIERQEMLEQERRLFIGAIAHDLRTPLFTLRSYLSGLKDGLATTPEKAARYVEVCQEKADALERLITDLFTYARMEYLEQAPELEPVELGKLLTEAVEDMRPAAVGKGVALLLDGPPEPCPLVGDPHLLARALANLLDNALRHTPSGGRVQVRWSQENEHLVFAVEDTGPGIASSDLPYLFTPLYRGEDSRNRRTGGAGLGLSIARGIIRAHGGELTAANTSNGGAVFGGALAVRPDVHAPPDTPLPESFRSKDQY